MNVTTSGGATGYTTSSSTTWAMPVTLYSGSGGSGGYTSPAPRPQTALEWLDAEIESMCKLARQVA